MNCMAFMSYTRLDDEHNDGQLTAFRRRLSNEVRCQTATEFPIFQDHHALDWGRHWPTRIDTALATVTLLIPVISPSFFASQACRAEVERFHDREKSLGLNDRILPLYYVETAQWENEKLRSSDPLAAMLHQRQYRDWRALRHAPVTDREIKEEIERLAREIRERIHWVTAAAPTG
ncbi:TIR domain-containing protein [Nonomuraea fuscirosea]|uniref:TIR domain-containing protein n=1 Tax=Nonomuraea fuscirosea TaxID=1291556 RepID=UPI0033FC6806